MSRRRSASPTGSPQRDRTRSRSIGVATVAAVGALLLGACSADTLVTARRADEIRTVPDPQPPTTTDARDPDDPADPDDTLPTDEPIGDPDPDAIDFGSNKPPRRYDEFLLAVVTDLEQWWAQQYPVHYGTDFEPLQGSIYAAYPERPDDIPGCGTERTAYRDVQQYVAFYCSDGDFFVYDDGDGGLLTELAEDYGASTIGTVFAHEFGHAVQLRFGAIDRGLPTITTEQQADCFAGAWTARVASGESTLVAFTDDDVRAGLIAMTKVSDPVGIDQFEPGGHGSAFDRVGAFQVGFSDGLDRCTELLDDPLPLVPNLLSADEVTTGGDAEFGYGEGQLLGFIPTDLNAYWDEELNADVPDLDPLTFTVVDGADDVACDDLRGELDQGAAWCATTDEVYFNEPVALDLYATLGDFAVGYVLGTAWSEAVQDALGSDLDGAARSLLNDCLTGGWVQTVIATDEDGDGFYELPQPRLESRQVRVSAGDLDEAIQTVLLVADPTSGIDDAGAAFDKIAAFRGGVLGGTESCLAQL